MKKKIIALCLIVALAATAVIGGTLAYFTADTKAHNVITSGGVSIKLNEWANEARTEKFEDKTGVMPGAEVTKIVEVENVGTGTAWVRVQVVLDVYAEGGKEQLPPDPVTLDFNETDWKYFDGYYYYNYPLDPGETTEPLFTTVTFDPKMGNVYQNSTAHVDVNAFAVQSANNGTGALDAAGWPSFTPPTNP